MAKQTTVRLIDDVDGSEAVETVTFALDGRSYEIDLSAENVTRLRDGLAPFVDAARRTVRNLEPRHSAPSTRRGDAKKRSEQLANIRAWAQARGVEVKDRGRVADEVEAAYWADPNRENVVAPTNGAVQLASAS